VSGPTEQQSLRSHRWGRLAASLAREPILAVLLAAAAALFAFWYAVDPSRPGLFTEEGWFGLSDQSRYLLMAHDISDGGLPAADFFYGPGYPALAVPFLWLGLDYDPWAVVNGLGFVFSIGATFLIARRLYSEHVGVLAAVGLLFASPLVWYVATPWNSTVTLVGALAIVLLATGPEHRTWHDVIMGAAVGLAFAARYVDFVWLALLTLGALALRPPSARLRGGLVAAGVALVIAVPVLGAHAAILGSPFETPYASHVRSDDAGSDQDLSSYDITQIPNAAFGMFVSPFLRGARQGGEALLQSMFWAVLALPGAVMALRRRSAHFRLEVAVVVVVAVATLFYLSFRTSGAGAVQFGGLHYFKFTWPFLAILAAYAATKTVSVLRGLSHKAG
jgi:hypothetical protein